MNYLFWLTALGAGEGGLGMAIYFQELGQNVMAAEAYREGFFHFMAVRKQSRASNTANKEQSKQNTGRG